MKGPQEKSLSPQERSLSPLERSNLVRIRTSLYLLAEAVARLDYSQIRSGVVDARVGLWSMLSSSAQHERSINNSLDILKEIDLSLEGDTPALTGADLFGVWDSDDKRYYYSTRLQRLNKLVKNFVPEMAEGMVDITDIEAGITLIEGSIDNQPMKEMYCDHVVTGIQSLLQSILELTSDSPPLSKRYLKLMQEMIDLITQIKAETLPSVLKKKLTDFRSKYYNVKVYYDARHLPSDVRTKFFEEPLHKVEQLTPSKLIAGKRENLTKILELMKEHGAIDENKTITMDTILHLGFTESATSNYMSELQKKKFAKSKRIAGFAHYWLTDRGVAYEKDEYFKQPTT